MRHPYSTLLPVGFAVPLLSPGARCALTAPFHPCRRPRPKAVCSLWHFPWGRPRRALPGTVDPRSPDFPPLAGFPQAAAVQPSGPATIHKVATAAWEALSVSHALQPRHSDRYHVARRVRAPSCTPRQGGCCDGEDGSHCATPRRPSRRRPAAQLRRAKPPPVLNEQRQQYGARFAVDHAIDVRRPEVPLERDGRSLRVLDFVTEAVERLNEAGV